MSSSKLSFKNFKNVIPMFEFLLTGPSFQEVGFYSIYDWTEIGEDRLTEQGWKALSIEALEFAFICRKN